MVGNSFLLSLFLFFTYPSWFALPKTYLFATGLRYFGDINVGFSFLCCNLYDNAFQTLMYLRVC